MALKCSWTVLRAVVVLRPTTPLTCMLLHAFAPIKPPQQPACCWCVCCTRTASACAHHKRICARWLSWHLFSIPPPTCCLARPAVPSAYAYTPQITSAMRCLCLHPPHNPIHACCGGVSSIRTCICVRSPGHHMSGALALLAPTRTTPTARMLPGCQLHAQCLRMRPALHTS